MEIKLTYPITIDEKKVDKIDLKLEDMTGADILKIDAELRAAGHTGGLRDVFDQNVLLQIASKGSGIISDDLKRLKMPDFIEVTFNVRNFLLGLSGQTEEQETSEKSSSGSPEQVEME